MKRLSLRQAFWVVLSMAVLSWAVLVVSTLLTGMLAPAAVATAIAFTGLLATWPSLAGIRRQGGHWERAALCRDCGMARWKGADFGFCLRCGSTRSGVPQGY